MSDVRMHAIDLALELERSKLCLPCTNRSLGLHLLLDFAIITWALPLFLKQPKSSTLASKAQSFSYRAQLSEAPPTAKQRLLLRALTLFRRTNSSLSLSFKRLQDCHGSRLLPHLRIADRVSLLSALRTLNLTMPCQSSAWTSLLL